MFYDNQQTSIYTCIYRYFPSKVKISITSTNYIYTKLKVQPLKFYYDNHQYCCSPEHIPPVYKIFCLLNIQIVIALISNIDFKCSVASKVCKTDSYKLSNNLK